MDFKFGYHQRKKAATQSINLKKIIKPAIYLIFIAISYIFGYLSALSLNNKPKVADTTPSTTTINSLSVTPVAVEESVNVILPSTATTASGWVSDDNHHHNRFLKQCATPSVSTNLVRKTILQNVFNGTSPWEKFPPPHVSPLLTRKRVSGWGSRGAVFENVIRKVKPKTIIEIGTFLGASTLHMVQLTKRLNLDTQIICLDDFRGWPGFRNQFKDIGMLNGDALLLHQFMHNVINAKASESILFLPFSTGSGLESLCEWGIYGDLIEVDAGHDFHSAWSDINLAYKLLKPGGVMFGHDYNLAADNRGVRRAVSLFAKLNKLNVQVDGQHWVLV